MQRGKTNSKGIHMGGGKEFPSVKTNNDIFTTVLSRCYSLRCSPKRSFQCRALRKDVAQAMRSGQPGPRAPRGTSLIEAEQHRKRGKRNLRTWFTAGNSPQRDASSGIFFQTRFPHQKVNNFKDRALFCKLPCLVFLWQLRWPMGIYNM